VCAAEPRRGIRLRPSARRVASVRICWISAAAAAWTAARSSRSGLPECVVTKRHWGNPATGCGTPKQPGPSDGWSDTRRVYRPGFLPLPSSLSPPSSLNLLRPRASRAVPTGSLSGRGRRTCEKTVPCGEILRRRAPDVGSARGSIAFARGTGCNCWPNTVRYSIAGVLVSTVVNLFVHLDSRQRRLLLLLPPLLLRRPPPT